MSLGGAIGQANEIADVLKIGLMKAAISASGAGAPKQIEHQWELWDGPDDLEQEEAGLSVAQGVGWQLEDGDATTTLLPPNYGGDSWASPKHGELLSGRMQAILVVLVVLAGACVVFYFAL